MSGYEFVGRSRVDGSTPLSKWFEEWVESLSSKVASTRTSYVGDVANFASVLAEVRGHDPGAPVPDAMTRQLEVLSKRFGVPLVTLRRCYVELGRLSLADLAPRFVARAVHRISGSYLPSRTRRTVSSLGSLTRYLVGQEILAANPLDSPAIELPALPVRQPVALSVDEMRRLFATCALLDPQARRPWPQRDLALVGLLCSTGLRESEVINLRVGDLVVAERLAHVSVIGKRNKQRSVPVHPEVLVVVERYLEERRSWLGEFDESAPLFVRSDGRVFEATALYRLVARLFARSGITPRSGSMVHALRHSFATHALDSGASIVEVQKLLGHSSLETTRRYLDVVGDGLRAAVSAHVTRELLAD